MNASLKKIILFPLISLIFCIAGLLVPAVGVSGHELIPQAVQDFLAKNPNATSEEIERFVKVDTPVFASKFKNIDDLMEIVRNQESSWLDNAYDFIKIGVKHILEGADHILFVLSLLLVVVSLREMVRITSAFTVAHSITLVLAGSGVLVVSSRVVEPLIALSIAFVAFTGVFLKGTRFEMKVKQKLGTVFFFGLFHGLGFAGLLQEIGTPSDNLLSSLFSFNIGIEIGQLVIVALGLPLILLIRKTQWSVLIIKVFALIIGVIGLIWGVQRVIG